MYNTNEKLIWDSGFGYEIVLYKGGCLTYNNYKVEFVTGSQKGFTGSLSKDELEAYSEEKEDELFLKYYND